MLIRPARSDELATCSALMVAAARWVAERHPPIMWHPADLTVERLLETYRPEEFRLAFLHDRPRPVCTYVLQDEDPLFWPDARPGEALYLHKLAAAHPASGGGLLGAVVAHALEEVRGRGRTALRLDVLRDRAALRRLYERQGFVLWDERTVGPHVVARYQLDPAPGATT